MFITLEGIEGAGKTTQIQYIVEFFKVRGYDCITTREPGGTPVGSRIRSILLDPENNDLDAGAELLLYVADRVQHIRTFINPHLASGRVVICDRYFDATLVYQGYARGLDKDKIRALHKLTCDNLQPDVTFLFDLDPAQGLKRAWTQINSGERTGMETRFEKETIAFHEKVRSGYLELARTHSNRFRVIDASGSVDRVAHAVETVLQTLTLTF
ncbi:MAG: dTMP kinase [Desulfobacteraceae bacterium]|nr:dTMP kinase [Desulfobacteraceae bacterium]